MEHDGAGAIDPAVEARLSELERASDERRAALQELAVRVPAEVSRREVVMGAITDVVRSPERWSILGRGLRKLARAPRALWRRLAS